ncbi:hypothetical protein PS723_03152 [Pseudomonas fluorescens]|uniref:Uncharacterized protein n=1 Tax=Pseudomonas fluorescens TaxID=294 RepID=A0A5E7CS88_PSEFL|nr:hypothetical protein PS723_03152 [Pseudomonas fluorescens]
MEIGQVGHGVVAKANGASVIKVPGQGFTHGLASASVIR